MRTQRFGIALIILNLLLLVLILSPIRSAFAQPSAEGVVPVLRAHSLEIVDNAGKTRAQIVIAPATSKDGKDYPETVLFRLIDPEGQPTVKMAASIEGSGMDLLGGPDTHGWFGLQFISSSEQSLIRLVDKQGQEKVLEP